MSTLEGLQSAADAFLARAQEQQQVAWVSVFDFADLAELRGLYGAEISRKVFRRVVRKLKSVVGDSGRVARTGRTEFALLMTCPNREAALAQIQRVMGKPCRVEFDADGCEIVLVPDFLLEEITPSAGGIEALHAGMVERLAAMREAERRWHHHLQRERERYTQPMPLTA